MTTPAVSSTAHITAGVIAQNNLADDARLKFILERLVTHLHDFARETRLSTSEWEAGIRFLTLAGRNSTDVNEKLTVLDSKEFILLSDVLGFSMLVNAINHPRNPPCTPPSVLGPFHSHESPELDSGSSLSSDPHGVPLLALCSVHDSQGRPLAGVKVDIWETDSTGRYDMQYADREGPSERCTIRSGEDGSFWFKAIQPLGYPIPDEGPVNSLVTLLNRPNSRPAHMHFVLDKDGYDHLITCLFMRDTVRGEVDVVFGVQDGLVVELTGADEPTAKQYGVAPGTLLLRYDFVMATAEEADALRLANATAEADKMGLKVKLIDNLPVPDVD